MDVFAAEPLCGDKFLARFATQALPGDTVRRGMEVGGTGAIFGVDGLTALDDAQLFVIDGHLLS